MIERKLNSWQIGKKRSFYAKQVEFQLRKMEYFDGNFVVFGLPSRTLLIEPYGGIRRLKNTWTNTIAVLRSKIKNEIFKFQSIKRNDNKKLSEIDWKLVFIWFWYISRYDFDSVCMDQKFISFENNFAYAVCNIYVSV